MELVIDRRRLTGDTVGAGLRRKHPPGCGQDVDVPKDTTRQSRGHQWDAGNLDRPSSDQERNRTGVAAPSPSTRSTRERSRPPTCCDVPASLRASAPYAKTSQGLKGGATGSTQARGDEGLAGAAVSEAD